ncbi:MAG: transposase [Candidatus Hodarchaeota archaeon]
MCSHSLSSIRPLAEARRFSGSIQEVSQVKKQVLQGKLWSRSYYTGTTGEGSREMIQMYIERLEHG